MDSDSGDDGHPSGTRFILVDDLDTLAVALDTLINCEIIALDAEGTFLSRHGKLCILQIGIPRWMPVEEDVYVIDVVALGTQAFHFREEEGAPSLKQILEDPGTVKLGCDCRKDSDALFHQHGVRLRGVTDIQVSEVAFRRMHGEPAPRVMGLRQMLDKYLPFKYIKELMPFRTTTASVKAGFEADPRAWEARPLSPQHVLYAAVDVAYMHQLADIVHEPLTADLKGKVAQASEERAAWCEGDQDATLPDAGGERAIAPVF